MDRFLKSFIILLLPTFILAHSLVLNLIDNEDGTITIVGGFSTGESASGALVKIESIDTKEILLEKRLSSESELTIKIPDIAYNVILDGGPSHKITRVGIAPKGGFKKSEKKKVVEKNMPKTTQISMPIKVSLVLAFLLLIATILVSIFNTNKIIRAIKEQNI